jgi:hypothetical protein
MPTGFESPNRERSLLRLLSISLGGSKQRVVISHRSPDKSPATRTPPWVENQRTNHSVRNHNRILAFDVSSRLVLSAVILVLGLTPGEDAFSYTGVHPPVAIDDLGYAEIDRDRHQGDGLIFA